MECVTRSVRLAGCFNASNPNRVISPGADFVPKFVVGPPVHTLTSALPLFPAQVWGPVRLARVLPRGDGVVQAGSDAVQFLSGHIADVVLVLWYGS